MSRDHGSDMGHFEELEHVSLMMSFRNAVPLDLLIRLVASLLYLIYSANYVNAEIFCMLYRPLPVFMKVHIYISFFSSS